ncbi:hypothetical protein C8N47_10728 [Mangrovibacterium marinum]|uniref:Uncharacterized protein n=1 Tax=Mangrovibacterium marinum TaxID=1639118 RepID=A0A2T5C1W7_9BACT|nr:hypothetical protein C8N47_10728 [Mangrovibacterium marinum]
MVCLVGLQLAQAQKTELGLNLEVGHSYTTQSVSVGTISQEMMGQDIQIDLEVVAAMSFKVLEESAAGYKLDVQYTSMVMKMKMPQMEKTFSSETPEAADPLSGMLAKMTDKSFQLVLSKKGEVLGVKDLDVLMNEAIDALGDLPEAQKQQLQKQLGDSYGENAFRGNMGSMLTIFPAKPVAVGESWSSELKLDAGMAMNLAMTYTYDGEQGDYYLVSGQGSLSTPELGATVESNGMAMSFEMTGSMSSHLKIDKKTGWVMAGTAEQTIDGKATIAGNDQMPEGMEIPMKMKTTTSYTGH